MPTTLFVTSATRALNALERMLDLTSAQPELLTRQLVPDMFPLHRQIDIVTTAVAGTVACLRSERASTDLAVFNRGYEHELEREHIGHEALRARVQHARTQLTSLREPGAQEGPVRVCKPGEQRVFASAHSFVIDYVLPNLFFHVAIAYAILRASGVALGKGDYMGQDAYEVEHAPSSDAPQKA